MKVLVTGAKGQLGYDVINELHHRNIEAVGVDVQEMDITDESIVREVLMENSPDAVIHCAAWTAVDAAEDEVEKCSLVNVTGTRNIARVCNDLNCKMLYLSTDYVFDGQGKKPWKPDDQVTKPLNIYGLTKYQGELAVREYVNKYFIVRISWVFGKNGKNFIKTMLNLAEKYDKLTVVNDQYGTPTYTYDLARLLVDMIQTEKYGYYHVTNEGEYISWYDFACEIFRQAGIEIEIVPVSAKEYASKARRPENSRMDKSKLVEQGFIPLPDWKDALGRYLTLLDEEKN
ncbi:MAG: dTDP-4-dehydrorhamnose reductase [Eubacterium sp.]|nr:dTDP-4-dehydrorhamnose reductase [Eubacterium sp.]